MLYLNYNMPTFPCILSVLSIFIFFYLRHFCNKFTATLLSVLLNFYGLHDKVAEILEENKGSFLAKSTLLLGRDILVTSNPSDVQQIFSTNFLNYGKGPEWRKRFDIFGNGSFNVDFDEWMGHRKSIRLLFSHQKFKQFMGKTVQECITKELIPTLNLVSEKELILDFRVLIKWFVSYISFSISAGHKPMPIDVERLEDDPLTKALDDAGEAILLRHLFPVFIWKLMKKFNIGTEKKYSEAWETLDSIFAQYASITQEELSKGRETQDEENFNSLKLYMIGHEIKRSAPSTYNNFRDNTIALIFASGDTTSTTISWFFLLLSRNPNVEAKIRKELKQAPQIQECDIKKFFMSNSDELDKMVYLEAAINETLRLYPPVPYQTRTPVHPDTLPSGHHVNQKTTIFISAYGMGRMKALWGEDSHEFKPERWITEDGKIRHEAPHKFFAFSAGPRICPGKDFAYVLLKTFVASIMQNFHVQVINNHCVTQNISVILQQKDGMEVKLKKIV